MKGCCGDSGEAETQMLLPPGSICCVKDTFLGTSGLVVCGASDWRNKVTLRTLLLCDCNGPEAMSMKALPAHPEPGPLSPSLPSSLPLTYTKS